MPALSGRRPFRETLWGWAPFVASAALVAFAIHLSLGNLWLGALLGMLALLVLVPQLRARRQMRRLLRSGDVERVMKVWEAWVDEVAEPRTMGPLIRATALAAYGLTEQSRRVLSQAARGDAWDYAIEHRLFVEVMLEAFEGNHEGALSKALELSQLPLPTSPWAKSRALVLRGAAGALARSFAHCAAANDDAKLRAAAEQNPLVFWAMRYAQAVLRIDRGQPDRAKALIAHAPSWPQTSVFHSFQAELSERAL